jgi:hypothetical protein
MVDGHRSENGNSQTLDTTRSSDFPDVALHRRHRTIHRFWFSELREGKNHKGSKAEENSFQKKDLETGSMDETMEDLPDSHGSDSS